MRYGFLSIFLSFCRVASSMGFCLSVMKPKISIKYAEIEIYEKFMKFMKNCTVINKIGNRKSNCHLTKTYRFSKKKLIVFQ